MDYFVRLKNHRITHNEKKILFVVKTEAGDTIRIEMNKEDTIMVATDLDNELNKMIDEF